MLCSYRIVSRLLYSFPSLCDSFSGVDEGWTELAKLLKVFDAALAESHSCQ